MDVSPIQRVAAQASGAVRPVQATESKPLLAPVAQASPASADEQTVRARVETPSLRVLVSWHPGSVGYVTQVVDQASGTVLHQTPPAQVLAMVLQVIARLEAHSS
jgi:hypothetical protein